MTLSVGDHLTNNSNITCLSLNELGKAMFQFYHFILKMFRTFPERPGIREGRVR